MTTSYFSEPMDHLDPSLFSLDNVLHSNIRHLIQDEATSAMHELKLKNSDNWLFIWLTGSGISYQWEFNTDLDVQLGIDYQEFLKDNPEYHEVDPYNMSEIVDRTLKEKMNPVLSEVNLNGKTFQITLFWNSLVLGDEIEQIRPYAAYDVINNKWIIEPPKLPSDPGTLFPAEWSLSVEADDISSQRLLQSHMDISEQEKSGGPAAITAKAIHNVVDAQAQSLYDDIHLGRSHAFMTGGHGYADWHNFRWQAAKANGTITRLKKIIDCHRAEQEEKEKALYGGPIKDSHEALQEALTWQQRQ